MNKIENYIGKKVYVGQNTTVKDKIEFLGEATVMGGSQDNYRLIFDDKEISISQGDIENIVNENPTRIILKGGKENE